MVVTIVLEDVARVFNVDEDQIINNDWNGVLADMLDTIQNLNKI